MPFDNYWGDITSTIDWCEENYTVSPYLAEFFNTTTNLSYVFLSLFGIYNILRNGSNKTFILAYIGVIFVGFGSWCFHMTLRYEMQLLDELPMIYVASLVLWLTYLADHHNQCGIWIPLSLVIYSAVVTYSYIIINNPVFHQVSYALLVFGVVFKSVSLYKKVPDSYTYEKPRLQLLLWIAASGFLIAFGLWNIDNQFCSHLRTWRHTVPLLVGAVSELHGWWHIGTGLGVYYYIVYCEWLVPVLDKEKKEYRLHWFGPICYLRPTQTIKKE